MDRTLDNLLSNALRHTPDGGEIRLLARHHGERVILSVEDNGGGKVELGDVASVWTDLDREDPFVLKVRLLYVNDRKVYVSF